MSLTEFLLARIAEDEEAARQAPWGDAKRGYSPYSYLQSLDALHVARHDPARVLAECEAKRRILSLTPIEITPNPQAWQVKDATALLLALPYTDHPDFDESWRAQHG